MNMFVPSVFLIIIGMKTIKNHYYGTRCEGRHPEKSIDIICWL